MTFPFVKYEPGQKVRIVKQERDSSAYRNYFNSEMAEKYSEKVVTLSHKSSPGSWRIEEDNRNWSWSEDMFKPVVAHTPDEAFKQYLSGHMSETQYEQILRRERG